MTRIADDSPVAVDVVLEFRPAVPPPRRPAWRQRVWVAACLAVLVAAMLGPLWPALDTQLLGDPETDAIRGMWGLDHVRRSLVPPDTPLWSGEVNFPHGVLAIILPLGTTLFLAPLNALFGPVAGYNLAIATMLWAAGLATAVVARQASGSWGAGLVAGAGFAAQPMLLFAVADGTPEHVAVWGIPAFLATLAHALKRRSAASGAAAGAMAVWAALDGPYNAVFAMVLGAVLVPVALWRALSSERRAEGLGATFAGMAVVALAGGAVLAALYANFDLTATDPTDTARLLQMNAADLHSWWQFDFGPDAVRDPSLAPTLIPTTVLVACLVLSLGGLRRSGAWLLAGTLALVLAFGWNAYLPKELAQWLRGFGLWVGNWVLTINVRAYQLPGLDGIRFPRRFLVPAALGFLVAGSVGLGALMRRLERLGRGGVAASRALAMGLAASVVLAGVYSGRLQTSLPMQPLPALASTTWLADQPDAGAVLTLPQTRAAPRSGKRADLQVFANLGDGLSSADTQYLQVRHGRPVMGCPSLKTLVPMRLNIDIQALTRNWDDLAHPMVTGNPIPRSAYDETSEPRRQATIEWLRRQGLRYVVVDMAVYEGEGFTLLARQLEPHTEAIHRFDDGSGVAIIALSAP